MRSPTTYVGIDPGRQGGVAVLAGELVVTRKMPTNRPSLLCFIRDLKDEFSPLYIVVEKVGGFMGNGGRNVASAHSMFNFGQGYGELLMAIEASGLMNSYEEVAPQTWQKAVGVGGKGKRESKAAWKNRLKDRAQELFPEMKVTLAVADALLLAWFGKLP